ncbi:hypothetical protein [Streptomyces sp. NPDC057438]|uniref:hypothetical protein n=1 Tax=Streptomyces sp. NPDC057438 TaxID=3346133 RepID=UPI0036CD50A5
MLGQAPSRAVSSWRPQRWAAATHSCVLGLQASPRSDDLFGGDRAGEVTDRYGDRVQARFGLLVDDGVAASPVSASRRRKSSGSALGCGVSVQASATGPQTVKDRADAAAKHRPGGSGSDAKATVAACSQKVLGVAATKEPADGKVARYLLLTVQNAGD